MSQPLAERMRPRTLDEYIGQRHLVGEGAVLRKMIESGRVTSFIMWGPPGVGKTTLAQIIAHRLETPFYTLSAVTSGVKDVRDVIKASKGRFFNENSPILFIDEIHRFSKSQQDSLLGAVERGVVKPAVVEHQWKRYHEWSFKDDLGITENGILIRRHNHPRVVELMELWWQEYLQGCLRDQVSLMPCVFKCGFMPHLRFIERNIRRNEWVEVMRHQPSLY